MYCIQKVKMLFGHMNAKMLESVFDSKDDRQVTADVTKVKGGINHDCVRHNGRRNCIERH